MLTINNNNKFVDFTTNNFWNGVDEGVLRAFALEVFGSSLTAFKVRFETLQDTKSVKVQEVYNKFTEFCVNKNYDLPSSFKQNAQKVIQDLVEQNNSKAINKFSLTKWKNRHRRKITKNFERNL